MTLVETMNRVTHREFLLRMDWRRRQLNKTSKLDFYLMRILSFLDAIWARRKKLQPESVFQVKFGDQKTGQTTAEEGKRRADTSRRSWTSALAAKAKRKTNGR